MSHASLPPPTDIDRRGLWAGIAAYSMWGFFPIYFKATAEVSALEILAHRVLWSVPFGLILILFRGQIPALITALKHKKTMMWLALSSFMIAVNWGVYIWAIQIDQVFQASLGYYINPLILVIMGVIFFGERLNRMQGIAIALATIAVMILIIYGGVIPWISLTVAVTFGFYGVIRKQVDVGAMNGLLIETLWLLGPSVAYLYYLHSHGGLVFFSGSGSLQILLLLAGPLTVLPLLAFATAARRIPLSVLGILQYIAPTLQFLCGIYFGEAFTLAHAICFALIWIAVGLFSWAALRKGRAGSVKKAPV